MVFISFQVLAHIFVFDSHNFYESNLDSAHLFILLGYFFPFFGIWGETIQLQKTSQSQINELVKGINDRKIAEEEIIETKRQLEELYKHLNDVRENERTGISREIHDELGQSLTALKMDLNWTMDNIGNTLTVKNKLSSMIDLVSGTIKKVQKISSDLRPGILDDLGLNSAIEWYCEEFEKRSGLLCHLELEEIPEINSKIQLTLFRIFQEGLTNILRHAKARNVYIKTFLLAEKIYLKVRDDGIGISEERMNSKNSLGLLGMKERLKQFNGTLEIISIENKGAALVICIPVIN